MPPNFFGIGLGLTGLGQVWQLADQNIGGVGGVVFVTYLIAAIAWGSLVTTYLLKLLTTPARTKADFTSEILAPFISLAPITGMILGEGLAETLPTAGKTMVIICAVVTLILGGWLTGQWIVEALDDALIHPGYFLPTVAGGFVGSFALNAVGFRWAALMSFGIGAICWLVVGSLVMNRLFFRPTLPPPLIPTLAIEVAPPAVAGIAWIQLFPDSGNAVQLALAGYACLMVIVQLRLIGLYRSLKFTPGFWAFTFSYCSVASYGILWLGLTKPAGSQALSWLLVALATILVGGIAVRTIIALTRRQFLPPA